jgi:hypothetical protein
MTSPPPLLSLLDQRDQQGIFRLTNYKHKHNKEHGYSI